MPLLIDLHAAVAAVAPINGVCADKALPKSSWYIDFQPQATADQRAAASAVLANFDIAADEAADQAEATRIQNFVLDPNQSDLVQRLRTASVADIDNWLTNNVTNLTQARAVLAAIIKFIVSKRLF